MSARLLFLAMPTVWALLLMVSCRFIGSFVETMSRAMQWNCSIAGDAAKRVVAEWLWPALAYPAIGLTGVGDDNW